MSKARDILDGAPPRKREEAAQAARRRHLPAQEQQQRENIFNAATWSVARGGLRKEEDCDRQDGLLRAGNLLKKTSLREKT